MSKPQYCRECGQRIEREQWYPWHNTGFCDRCAPRSHLSWLGRALALVALGVVMGFSLGSWSAARQNAPAPLLRIEHQAASILPDLNSALAQQQGKERPLANPDNSRNLPQNQPESTSDQSSAKASTKLNSKAEQVGICGAPTKSGKPCRRRVKGGGRCWQHRGQAK